MSIFGKPKYGGNFVKRKWWKLKDGDSTFRILPPIGEDGIWSKFYNVHYGYKNTKGEMRVFQSSLVKNRKTKMIESPDAALERIEKMKAQYEEARKSGNKALFDQLDKFVGQKGMYNLDNNHYVNAMDEQGNIGILKLRHRAMLALQATIKRLRDDNIDPLSAENGRYFVFSRSGMGLDTTFQVTVKKKKLRVEGVGEVEQDWTHVIDAETANRCAEFKDGKVLYKEAANLSELFKRPSSEEVARIVKEADVLTGKSPAIDALFDTKKDDTAATDDSEEEGEIQSTGTTTASLHSSQTAQAAAPVTATTAQATPEPTPAPAQTAPATAPKTETLASAPKTTGQAVSDMSVEDFLKDLGVNA